MKDLVSEKKSLKERIGGFFSPNRRLQHCSYERIGSSFNHKRIPFIEITEEVVESEIGLQYCLFMMGCRDSNFGSEEIFDINKKFGFLTQKLHFGGFDCDLVNNSQKFSVAFNKSGKNHFAIPGLKNFGDLKRNNYVPIIDILASSKNDRPLNVDHSELHIIKPQLITLQGCSSNEKGFYAVSRSEGDRVRYTVYVSESSADLFPSKKVISHVGGFVSYLASNCHVIDDLVPLHNCSREKYRRLSESLF